MSCFAVYCKNYNPNKYCAEYGWGNNRNCMIITPNGMCANYEFSQENFEDKTKKTPPKNKFLTKYNVENINKCKNDCIHKIPKDYCHYYNAARGSFIKKQNKELKNEIEFKSRKKKLDSDKTKKNPPDL